MKTTYAILILCCLLFVIACGTAKRGTPHYASVATTKEAVAKGEVVYNIYCQKCHPGGATGVGPALNNKPLPGTAIRFQVRHGMGMMPAFKEDVISDEEMDNLIAYMKVLRKAKDKTK
ncbi:c-type cytochrome [Pontibacter harenae]|uniref:c-type cytochrome n=1 Tax=Pontibacter harenae TaxID=2894083 RepID=UPI001E5C5408|nr:cytochrome c [Pontibacter harenae]MCC9168160.1 cytochrome c [Pontibacter harenae]